MKGNPLKPISGQTGSATVISLLLLTTLTIVGISSINNSTVELKISHNERTYHKNFYQAESAAHEGAQRLKLENDPEELRPAVTTADWLIEEEDADLTDTTNWVDDDSQNDNSDASVLSTSASFASVGKGVAGGSSLDLSATSLHDYALYGLSISSNGKVLIEMGYRKRF